MGARTKARKRALDVLFEADQRGSNASSVLNERMLRSGRETPLPPYAAEIVRGVVSRWVELNVIIQESSPRWTIARMPGVDRALLRIATWEILCNEEVPVSVAINEAVTLATQLSTDESPAFINGLLSTIAKDAPALSRAHMDDEVEVADGAAVFDSLRDDPMFGGATADDDAEEEAAADYDFPDSGLSDEVATAWAAALIADAEAVVVLAPDADSESDLTVEAVADAVDGSTKDTETPAEPNSETQPEPNSESHTETRAAPQAEQELDLGFGKDDAPKPTHQQD